MASSGRTRTWTRTLFDTLVFILVLTVILWAIERRGGSLEDISPAGRLVAIDGDTLRGPDGDIRLYGIDAPELFQTCAGPKGTDYPCGREARTRLRQLTQGRTLTCEPRDTDRFGRTVAVCRAGDVEINRQMVEDGWAIAFPGRADYAAAEAQARAAGRGLWSGAFDPPRDWRRTHAR